MLGGYLLSLSGNKRLLNLQYLFEAMKALKPKIEAILFCSPEGVDSRKLAKLCGIGSAGHIKAVVKQLAEDYKKRGAGLEVARVGNAWMLKVASTHAELVKEAAKPELSSAILETLAFIAWRGSPTQAAVIKARSNKAYNHLIELEEQGFVEKKRFKNTYKIKPTKRFYEYFKLESGEKLEVPIDK